MRRKSSNPALLLLIALALAFLTQSRAQAQTPADVLLQQSQSEADRKSAGCVTCHTATDSATMHNTGTVRLGCTDCHGGNSEIRLNADAPKGSPEYEQATKQAHPQSRNAEHSRTSANPTRAYTQWLAEDWDYVRFVNPGDLRVAEKTCGTSGCHTAEVRKVQTSMMTHGAMLWGAALYNNGAYPLKTPHFGESYGPDGTPQRLLTFPAPTPEEISKKGILPYLDPLQRWEISQPGNVLRVFERGSKKKPEVGNPGLEEDPGKPEIKLSERGFGTELRTDPVFLGLQKTRLLDPLLSFPGTNDQAGDYRASGCSACHVVYANDRSPEHSGVYAASGNQGQTATADPTIPRNESGHPIRHQFTRSIPSSQCMVCHMHPGTNMVATYFGYTWWDNEMDGQHMWPAEQRHPNAQEENRIQTRNPERSAVRGLWSDPDFLEKTGTPEFNQQLQNTQFADFHSHGWIFRAAFKHDRKGNLLDKDDKTVSFEDPDKFGKAVHLKDIHLEKGMHCIDCHFEQDSHGNGKLYGETRNAIEIDCVDCHGTIQQHASLITSGTAAYRAAEHPARLPDGSYRRGDRLGSFSFAVRLRAERAGVQFFSGAAALHLHDRRRGKRRRAVRLLYRRADRQQFDGRAAQPDRHRAVARQDDRRAVCLQPPTRRHRHARRAVAGDNVPDLRDARCLDRADAARRLRSDRRAARSSRSARIRRKHRLDPADLGAARDCWEHGAAAAAGPEAAPPSGRLFLPMRTDAGAVGVIGIVRERPANRR